MLTSRLVAAWRSLGFQGTSVCSPPGAELLIEGPNTKVVQIAIDKVAHGWSADEIQAQHPHLSLAQIHAALSYYYDHRAEIDAEIERMAREDEALRAQSAPSKAELRLRRRGLMP